MPDIESWGADTLISMPVPLDPDSPAMSSLGPGWVFVDGGLRHDLDLTEFEQISIPTFYPESLT